MARRFAVSGTSSTIVTLALQEVRGRLGGAVVGGRPTRAAGEASPTAPGRGSVVGGERFGLVVLVGVLACGRLGGALLGLLLVLDLLKPLGFLAKK